MNVAEDICVVFLKSGWQLGTGETDRYKEADITFLTGASSSGARQQRAAKVDAIVVPWVGALGKRNLNEELGVLILSVGLAGEAVERREALLGSLSLRAWDEYG